MVSAPMPRLKRAQYWLLDNVLGKLEPHDAAHGFRVGRSIMSNAAQHTNKAIVINLDLKDFFPSIGFHRVDVDIRDQIARTTIEESFVNHTDQRLEGVPRQHPQGRQRAPDPR